MADGLAELENRPLLPNGDVDFVAIADAYAEEIVAKGAPRFGKWLQLAAKRYLKDRRRAREEDSAFLFSEWHANDPCKFIELLPHVEGVWDSPTIVLHPCHVFATVNIFGFRRREDGARRFTTALFAVARKNAKSTWAACVALYCLAVEGEMGPQVISAATTGSQARIVWGVAKKQVDMTSDLREEFALEGFANSIACYGNAGSFKPINAKASTQDGLNPSCVVIDELHAHRNHDLLNVLKTAAGARRSPLFLYTTTEGYESPGPWPEERKFAEQVLEGVVEAEHYWCVIYAVDKEDADFDPDVWEKANPLMSVNNILGKKIAEDALEAKAKPGKVAEFRIKRLNRRSASADSWVNLAKWKACGGAVDLDSLQGAPCWAAFDLSSTTDLTSWRLIWRKDGKVFTWGRRWIPEGALEHRSVRGTVPFQAWAEEKLVTVIPGEVIDYDVVERAIIEDCERFNPRLIAFDDWQAADISNRLVDKGLPLVKFIQGPKSYHPAMTEAERLYISGQLVHGNDPVFNWCVSNVVARLDANMNKAPDKKKSPEKIDDAVSFFMAVGISLGSEDEGSWDDFVRNPVVTR